jgi:thioredoxin reductase
MVMPFLSLISERVISAISWRSTGEETTRRGVFAIGDVRAKSVKRSPQRSVKAPRW